MKCQIKNNNNVTKYLIPIKQNYKHFNLIVFILLCSTNTCKILVKKTIMGH